ncbi:MAG: hypothetical protein ASARMPRED_006382 [Alectoria sarmentosa]|nr:MAG: hypothetical protein ASARMPRED_006382 [Alectoria sarmentosa]
MLRRKARVQDVEIMKADGQKRFSLLDNGILDQSITKLLLVNVNASSIVHPGFSEETNKKRQGMNDEIFPVEDSMIPLQNGDVKSVRFIPNSTHMGEPAAGGIILIEDLFGNIVENTVPEWVKRRDAEINDSDEDATSTQPPSSEVSTYRRACSTLRESLRDREATTEDFSAFFSTAAPHALSPESLLRLRTIFLINASGSTLQPGQKTRAKRHVLSRASELRILALANLEVFGAMARKRVHGGERVPEGDPEWLKKKLSEFRAFIAQSKESVVENMIGKGPDILKDDETFNRVLIENREKVQMAYGSSTVGNNGEAARTIALARHISTLGATILGDVFGLLAKRIKEAIENNFTNFFARVLIRQGEAGFNGLCMMHGGVEGL